MSLKAKHLFQWVCRSCDNECLPVSLESRCICGHRHKSHQLDNDKLICATPKCKCRGFFYIVAEGAWILRCKCKHKHIEHDCSKKSYPCIKCSCNVFDSPWVCNCGHGWGNHSQCIVITDSKRSSDSIEKLCDSIEKLGDSDNEVTPSPSAVINPNPSISKSLSRKIYSMRQDGLPNVDKMKDTNSKY
jgi:Protein FAM221A/B